MSRRKYTYALVKLSLAPDVTPQEARRELRTRVNEGCCYIREEDEVRVVSVRRVVA